MKNLLLSMAVLATVACVAGSAPAADLEMLEPEVAQVFAKFLSEQADEIENPQVKVQGDVEKACGVSRDALGLILVPQQGLVGIPGGADVAPGAPAALLFMTRGLAPLIDGKPVEASKMHTLEFIGQDGTDQKVSCLALSVHHTEKHGWHLYGYGTGEEPVLDVIVTQGKGPGTLPLALEVRQFEDQVGRCYLTFFNRYQSKFKVAYRPPEEATEKPAEAAATEAPAE